MLRLISTFIYGFTVAVFLLNPLVDCFSSLTEFNDLLVSTKKGVLRGLSAKNGEVRKFLGIPFAQPPQGNLRWKAAIDAKPWSGIKNAHNIQKRCPQVGAGIYLDEDCLYLNVYTPKKSIINGKGLVPVFVWFFGGAFFIGDGHEFGLYNGEEFAFHSNVIVVTVNYRLGPLGFLVANDEIAGNFGITDQIMALQWVRNNIKSFGGNPDAVTIYGESAGAMSCAIHMTTEASKGLFNRLIMMSNPFSENYKSLEAAKFYGNKFVKNIGCNENDNDCLLSVPTSIIVLKQIMLPDSNQPDYHKIGDTVVWGPVIDKKLIKEQPFELIQQGKFHREVEVILGTVRDESYLIEGFMEPLRLIYNYPKHLFNYDNYRKFLRDAFKEKYYDVVTRYPPSTDAEINYSRFHEIITSYTFTCPNRVVARALSSFNIKTYLYKITKVADYLLAGACSRDRVCHASELPYVFGSLFGMPAKPSSQDIRDRLNEISEIISNALLPNYIINSAEYIAIINAAYKTQSKEILQCFPPSDINETNLEYLHRLKEIISQKCSIPSLDNDNLLLNKSFACSVAHICELSIIKFSEEEEKIITFIFTKFSAFANGDINLAPTEWPTFESSEQQLIEINAPFKVVSDPDREACDFWDKIGYNY